MDCDVVVIGGGPGGYSAAFRAADLGLKVVLVERYATLGGVCLNVGCIPSKALLRNAELAHLVNNEAKTFGIRIDGEVTFEYGPAFDRSRTVADGRVKGVHYLMKKNKITELDGRGTFTDDHTLQVEGPEGTQTVTFDHCVIAAGATTKLLPGTELSERVVTYEEQIMTRDLPESVIIAGAGAIGVEFAYVMHNYGVKVTIVEFLDRMVPNEDVEVSKELARRYKKLGIEVLTSTRVESIEDSGPKVRVTVSKDGQQQVLEADKVLQAIGFQPRVAGYGLENTGVALTERGAIDIDGRCRTNVPHIFAIGDIVGNPMLAHKATHEGKLAAEVAFGEKKEWVARVIPSVAYTNPEIAWVGVTETEAKAKGLKVGVAKFPWAASGRAIGIARTEGFTKLIFDEETHRVIGGAIVGVHAGELLAEIGLAIEMGAEAEDIGHTIHAHPTLSESVAMASEIYDGTITDLYIPKKK